MSRVRVFVGYGYNARDRWVETHVIPLVDAFACTAVHGKAAVGASLSSEVLRQIQSSDAMIGFTTRREPVPGTPDQFSTHPWVVQELAAAMSQIPPIPFVEVREEGVLSPGGMIEAHNAQRIGYRESHRADCLVQIAQALAKFRDEIGVTTIRLAPDEVVDQISEYLYDTSFLCRVSTLRGAVSVAPVEVPVFPGKGGLFVRLRGVQAGDLVQIVVAAGGHTWRSDYELLDTVGVQLKSGS